MERDNVWYVIFDDTYTVTEFDGQTLNSKSVGHTFKRCCLELYTIFMCAIYLYAFFFIFTLFNKIYKAGKGAVRWPQV